MPPRKYLPQELMPLIYAGLNQRNARTLRILGRGGNAAAAARARELSRERRAKRAARGRGLYHGPYGRRWWASAPLGALTDYHDRNVRIDHSKNERLANAYHVAAAQRRFDRVRQQQEYQGRRNVVATVRVGDKTVYPGYFGLGKVVKADDGHYYESRRIAPGRAVNGQVAALWHRL